MNEKKRVEIGGKREKRTTAKVFLDSELPFQWNGSCLFTGKKQYGDQKSHHCFYFSFFARASALISLSFAARPLHVLSISWLKRKLRDFSQSMKVKAVKQPGLFTAWIQGRWFTGRVIYVTWNLIHLCSYFCRLVPPPTLTAHPKKY